MSMTWKLSKILLGVEDNVKLDRWSWRLMPSQSTESKKSWHSQTRLVCDRCCALVNSFLNRCDNLPLVTTSPGPSYCISQSTRLLSHHHDIPARETKVRSNLIIRWLVHSAWKQNGYILKDAVDNFVSGSTRFLSSISPPCVHFRASVSKTRPIESLGWYSAKHSITNNS